jgi:hypothetical protein
VAHIAHLTAKDAARAGYEWSTTPGGQRRVKEPGGAFYMQSEPSRAELVIEFKRTGPVFLRRLKWSMPKPAPSTQLDLFPLKGAK